jgi:hypothetical protein
MEQGRFWRREPKRARLVAISLVGVARLACNQTVYERQKIDEVR